MLNHGGCLTCFIPRSLRKRFNPEPGLPNPEHI